MVMKQKGEIIIDRKRNFVYRVKDIKDDMILIERVLPSSHLLTELELPGCYIHEESTGCVL